MDNHALYSYDPSDPRLHYYQDAMLWPSLQPAGEASTDHDIDNPSNPRTYSEPMDPSRALASQWQMQHHDAQEGLNGQQSVIHNAPFQQYSQEQYQHQYGQQFEQQYGQPMQPHLGYMPIQQQPTTNNATPTEMPMIRPYSSAMEAGNSLAYMPTDLQNGLNGYPIPQPVHASPFNPTGQLSTSPQDNFLDIAISPASTDSDWQVLESASTSRNSFGSFRDLHGGPVVSDPGRTLALNNLNNSETNSPQYDQPSPAASFGSFEDVPFPVTSPRLDAKFEPVSGRSTDDDTPATSSRTSKRETKTQGTSPAATSQSSRWSHTSQASTSSSSSTSSGIGSPPSRHKTSPANKVSKPATKKSAGSSAVKKDPNEPRKVGKRKGPLRPEQREQAGQIRKLRACLRCKCLKKTCDTGDPCAGCKPAHVRNWIVPCTRIDVKDVSYFMKDWSADYERHVTLQLSVANIVGYGDAERPLWVTHGFGFVLPINAREIYVRDTNCFDVDWIEGDVKQFDMATAKLTAGKDGVSLSILHEYLDHHIDHGFERFVNEHFEGTPFLTDLLMTSYRYFVKTKIPIVKKALKLVVAYNLTQHITLLEGLTDEDGIPGRIEDDESKYYGKTVAPVMINFQIKCALAKIWRDLQKDVLEELSRLFTGVYGRDKLKNWPKIYALTTSLLIVWEEMQFDAQYREPNHAVTEKFINEMENVPVGVIVGLFTATAQRLPPFTEWDTRTHQTVYNYDATSCEVMQDFRDAINRCAEYLKDRTSCKFDREDFDSLNAKFTHRLVIRAN